MKNKKQFNQLLFLVVFFLITLFSTEFGFGQKEKKLHSVLGIMPTKTTLLVDTLEKVKLDNGWRYRINYLAEESNTEFHTPKVKEEVYQWLDSCLKK